MKIYKSKSELVGWVRHRLGEPLITVPLDDAQLDTLIDDACQYFAHFSGGMGHEEQFILINICEDKNNDNNGSLVDLEEGNCDPYDVSSASGSGAFIKYKAEYQLPRNVEAIMQEFPGSSNAMAGDQQLLSYATASAAVGVAGSLGGYGVGYQASGGFGNRGGSRANGGGYGIDLITFEIGMEYLEMWRQRYSIKLRAQFLDQARKVRFSPSPTGNINGGGEILLGVWTKVSDELLYEHIWVKNYALALSKIQVASNMQLFGQMAFPGGTQLNYEVFEKQGENEKEELEKQLHEDGRWSQPIDFIVG